MVRHARQLRRPPAVWGGVPQRRLLGVMSGAAMGEWNNESQVPSSSWHGDVNDENPACLEYSKLAVAWTGKGE
jgi:hypothetical protein